MAKGLRGCALSRAKDAKPRGGYGAQTRVGKG